MGEAQESESVTLGQNEPRRVVTSRVENGRIEVDAGLFSEGPCVKVVILDARPRVVIAGVAR